MLRVDLDLSRLDARQPQFARLGIILDVPPDRHSQIDPQSLKRCLEILMLASFFTRLANNSSGIMGDHDRRFDLVSVLSSGPAGACSFDRTFLEELIVGQTGWVNLLAQLGFRFIGIGWPESHRANSQPLSQSG